MTPTALRSLAAYRGLSDPEGARQQTLSSCVVVTDGNRVRRILIVPWAHERGNSYPQQAQAAIERDTLEARARRAADRFRIGCGRPVLAATDGPEWLKKRYATLASKLNGTTFGAPVYIDSDDRDGMMRGEVFGILPGAFGSFSATLR